MGQDENTNPFNGNETPVFETPTPTPAPAPAPEAPVAPAPAPTPVAEAPAAPAPIPVTKPGQVSESVSQLSSYNRLGMRPSRNLSAREELDRIAPKAPAAPVPAAKEKGPRDPKIKIIIVLVIVTAIALVAMLVISAMSGNGGIFGGKKNSAVSTSGEANLDVIFDDKAYLPYYENGLWGYKNPENGEVVIRAKYTAAERFYGDYAAVSFVDGDTAKSAIIDKEGNAKIEQDTLVLPHYDSVYGVWYFNKDIYDRTMAKLNPKDTVGKYLGNGSISVLKGSTTDIINNKGQKIYSCKKLCTVFSDRDGKFAAINEIGKNPSVISLEDGSNVYSNKETKSIVSLSYDQFLATKTSGREVILSVKSGSIEEDNNFSEKPYGYTIKECSNGYYELEKDGKKYGDCKFGTILYPSQQARDYLEANNKEYIIVTNNNKTAVYNLKESKIVKEIGGEDALINVSNGIIIYEKDGDKEKLVNINTLGEMSLEKNPVVSVKDNYAVESGTSNKRTISSGMKRL